MPALKLDSCQSHMEYCSELEQGCYGIADQSFDVLEHKCVQQKFMLWKLINQYIPCMVGLTGVWIWGLQYFVDIC